jgi:hypothetical protein
LTARFEQSARFNQSGGSRQSEYRRIERTIMARHAQRRPHFFSDIRLAAFAFFMGFFL